MISVDQNRSYCLNITVLQHFFSSRRLHHSKWIGNKWVSLGQLHFTGWFWAMRLQKQKEREKEKEIGNDMKGHRQTWATVRVNPPPFPMNVWLSKALPHMYQARLLPLCFVNMLCLLDIFYFYFIFVLYLICKSRLARVRKP